jgi:hypothetical protein
MTPHLEACSDANGPYSGDEPALRPPFQAVICGDNGSDRLLHLQGISVSALEQNLCVCRLPGSEMPVPEPQ